MVDCLYSPEFSFQTSYEPRNSNRPAIKDLKSTDNSWPLRRQIDHKDAVVRRQPPWSLGRKLMMCKGYEVFFVENNSYSHLKPSWMETRMGVYEHRAWPERSEVCGPLAELVSLS